MNLNLALVNYGPGQHISLVRTHAGQAVAYGVPGVWAALHETTGNQSLYIVSHWGEHTSPNPMNLPETAPLAFFMDDGIKTIKFGDASVTVGDELLEAAPPQVRMPLATSPATVITQQFADGLWVVKVRHLIPSLHPVAYTTLELRATGSIPDFSPIEVGLQIPGADPILLSSNQLAGCRCQLSARVFAYAKIPDPSGERNRAVRNSHLTPHKAKVVPVLP